MSDEQTPILCPNCGHDIEWHVAPDEFCTRSCESHESGHLCECSLTAGQVARALLAERDAKLAAVRKVRDHWAGAEYESLREQNIIVTIVDDFTEALGES